MRDEPVLPDAEFLTSDALAGVRHGFFTRRGGVSTGAFAALNCSLSSADAPGNVAANRARVAAALDLAPERLLGLTQVHGTDVVTVHASRGDVPWPAGGGGRADAMVTRAEGLGLGVITADCAPVLFADPEAGVVGAAHAGWRGAAAGILAATVGAMAALGADPGRTTAVIGPCIGPRSYEVGDDMRDSLLSTIPGAEGFFAPGARRGHHLFDLPAFCAGRLAASGVGRIAALDADTLPDEARFFSHRRRTLAGGGPIGHQVSVIRL